jgi:hypothetical protein
MSKAEICPVCRGSPRLILSDSSRMERTIYHRWLMRDDLPKL